MSLSTDDFPLSKGQLEKKLNEAISKAIPEGFELLLNQFKMQCTEKEFKYKLNQILKFQSRNWGNHPSLENAVKILNAIRSSGIIFDLSSIPLLSFCRLIFDCPKYAHDLLEKTIKNIEDILENTEADVYEVFKLQQFKYAFQLVSLIAFPKDSVEFNKCINLLSEKGYYIFEADVKQDDIDKMLPSLVRKLVQKDCPISVATIPGISFKTFIDKVLNCDSANTFMMNLDLIKGQLTDDKKVFDMLEQAVNKGAFKCVRTYLQKFKVDEQVINQLAQKAANAGDGLMVLALCNDQPTKAAEFFFGDQSEFSRKKMYSRDEDLKSYFFNMLRFTPIEKVDEIVKAFSTTHPNEFQLWSLAYDKAKEYFYSVAPFFARYKTGKDLDEVKSFYKNKDDMKYGEERLDLARKLDARLSFSDKDKAQPFEPQSDRFKALPKSKNNTQRAAALLEEISTWNHKNQNKRGFNSLRSTNDFNTPVAGRYEWAEPLVSSIFYHSQSNDMGTRNLSEWEYYRLNYNNAKLNAITMGNAKGLSEFVTVWNHGRAPVADTWGKIEDLFEDLWSMNLKKPGDYAKKEDYENKLTEFYSMAAELVWLIGNTQPMERGSGSFAELMLAIVTRHHGLQPPILRLEFPQLDVLDITFPLKDYKYLFPYLFEPSTMPEHLRKHSISSSISVFDQMTQLYQHMDKDQSAGIKYATSPHILLPKSQSPSSVEKPDPQSLNLDITDKEGPL